jgi:ketosteroid isomerase-like protein
MMGTDCSKDILAAIEREKAAVASGNWPDYQVVLCDDAVFMPPMSPSKSGEELKRWLASFLRDVRVEWLEFKTIELEASGGLAYHAYLYTWRTTPRAGGEAKVSRGKGLHILRRQADGGWRIAREIWNDLPDPVRT